MKMTPKLQAALDALCSADMDELAFELADQIKTTDEVHGYEDESVFDTLEEAFLDLGRKIVENHDETSIRRVCAEAIIACDKAYRELTNTEDPEPHPVLVKWIDLSQVWNDSKEKNLRRDMLSERSCPDCHCLLVHEIVEAYSPQGGPFCAPALVCYTCKFAYKTKEGQ